MTPEEQELRIERQAICEVEKVPQPEIDRIFDAYPSIYGAEAPEYRLKTMNGRKGIQGQPQGKKAA